MSLTEILIVGLAAGRGYQLLAHDSILDTPRQWVDNNWPRVGDWLSCAWCAGFWIALLTVSLWFTDLRWVILFGAVAEVASLAGLHGTRLSNPTITVNNLGDAE